MGGAAKCLGAGHRAGIVPETSDKRLKHEQPVRVPMGHGVKRVEAIETDEVTDDGGLRDQPFSEPSPSPISPA